MEILYIPSKIYPELREKYETREMMGMWNQLWTLCKVLFAVEILVWSYGMTLFPLVVAMVVLLAIWHLMRI